jgi:anti-sigma factor RsiW
LTLHHPPAEWFERWPDLPQAARSELLAHTLECAACQERLTRDDPSRAFALLAARSLPDDWLERVSRDVDRAVAASAARPASRGLRGGGWAAIAASLLLALALAVLAPDRPEAPVAAVPRVEAVQADKGTPFGGAPAATIQLLSPQDAEVYDISVGDTRIVMVFDAEIDI